MRPFVFSATCFAMSFMNFVAVWSAGDCPANLSVTCGAAWAAAQGRTAMCAETSAKSNTQHSRRTGSVFPNTNIPQSPFRIFKAYFISILYNIIPPNDLRETIGVSREYSADLRAIADSPLEYHRRRKIG